MASSGQTTSYPEAWHLKKACGVVWCYLGPPEQATEAFAPVRALGPPVFSGVQTMPYPALQQAFDTLNPPGLQWYWRADNFTELSDEANPGG